MENKTQKISLGFGFCILSVLFFFNPNVSIIDVLPDFFGYLLLVAGLAKFADLNDSVAAARTQLTRLIWISGARLLALFWIFGLAFGRERTAALLLWTFVFATLELIFSLFAVSSLMTGITELGTFYDNTSILGYSAFQARRKKHRKNYTEKLQRLTVVFVVAKSVLPVLPELADLTNTSYNEESHVVNLYRYIGIMRFLATVPVLILGVLWLVRCLRYLIRVQRDEPFVTGVKSAYRERITPRNGVFVVRRVRAAFAVLITAMLLTIELRIENITLLPDFIAAAVLLVFFLMLLPYLKKIPKVTYAALSCLFATSVLSYLAERYFFANYSYTSVIKSAGALKAFVFLSVADGLKALSLAGAIACVIWVLNCLITEHTGYMVGQSTDAPGFAERVESTQKELRGVLIPVAVSGAIYVLSDIAYTVFARLFGFMGLLNFVCAALFLILLIRALSEIFDSVRVKYSLQ